jgi:hypothetical protein
MFQNAAVAACIALFDIQITFISPTDHIYVFHKILSLNIAYLPNNINSPAFEIHTYWRRKRCGYKLWIANISGIWNSQKRKLDLGYVLPSPREENLINIVQQLQLD